MTFKCAWLADSEIPDWVKPDVSGVIAFPLRDKKRLALVPAGSPVSEDLRAWAKIYAEKHSLDLLG